VPFTSPAKPGGRSREVDMREVINTVLSLNRTGCQWDLVPDDLLPNSSVSEYFAQWRREVVWQQMMDAVRAKVPPRRRPRRVLPASIATRCRRTNRAASGAMTAARKYGPQTPYQRRGLGTVVVFVSRAAINDAVAAPQVLQQLGRTTYPRLAAIWVNKWNPLRNYCALHSVNSVPYHHKGKP
jgi:putative transposase